MRYRIKWVITVLVIMLVMLSGCSFAEFDIQHYETFVDAISAASLSEDDIFDTIGFDTQSDGGGGRYSVSTIAANGIPLYAGLYAHYVIEKNVLNLAACGGKHAEYNTSTQCSGDFAWGIYKSMERSGLTIYAPAGLYPFFSSITIGNGNGGSSYSTVNSVTLRGDGTSADGIPATETTEFYFYHTYDTPCLSINGRISSITVEDISIQLNGNSCGVLCTAIQNCLFDRVKIAHPRSGTYCLKIMGGNLPTGNYNINNTFNNVMCSAIRDGTIALIMDGVLYTNGVSTSNDTWLTSFNNCRFDVFGQWCIAGWFKFVDNVSFNRCHFSNQGGKSDAKAIYFDSAGMTYRNCFPSGLSFYSCSISRVYENIPTGCSQGVNYFVGHGVDDGELIPAYVNCPGITAHGEPFNGWGTTGGVAIYH